MQSSGIRCRFDELNKKRKKEQEQPALFAYLLSGDSNDAECAGTAMTGDYAAGLHPFNSLNAHAACGFLRNGAAFIGKAGGMNESHQILLQRMLFHKVGNQLRDHLLCGAAVFLLCHQLAIDDFDAGVQIQDIAYQRNRVAHAAASAQIVEIVGNEAHLSAFCNALCRLGCFIQRNSGLSRSSCATASTTAA